MTLVKSNSTNRSALPYLFDDFFTRDLFNWNGKVISNQNSNLSSVNIFEANDFFLIEMIAPGMKKEDFQIELENELLKVSFEKTDEEKKNKEFRLVYQEYNYASFQRILRLPKNVIDGAKVSAKYEDGILKITVPKKEEAKSLPPRTIEIA